MSVCVCFSVTLPLTIENCHVCVWFFFLVCLFESSGALLNFIKTFGQDYNKLREQTDIEAVFSFSSAKKRMGTVISSQGLPVSSEGSRVLHVKGAAEVLLQMSTRYVAA